MEFQQMIDEAVEAYEDMMVRRVALAPTVERANRLAQELVAAAAASGADPAESLVPFLSRIAEVDRVYEGQPLPTHFHVTIGEALGSPAVRGGD
ncbi:hypothetical protein [Nocardioides pakistanensis]